MSITIKLYPCTIKVANKREGIVNKSPKAVIRGACMLSRSQPLLYAAAEVIIVIKMRIIPAIIPPITDIAMKDAMPMLGIPKEVVRISAKNARKTDNSKDNVMDE